MGTHHTHQVGKHGRLACLFFLLFFASLPTPWPIAAPIRIPDLKQCDLATDSSIVGPPQTLQLNCCLPIPAQRIVNFSFDEYRSQRRVRQAAHTVSEDYVAKYNRAYELMKALPADDPRSFHTQANVHCAFCNFAYRQAGSESVPLQVHYSWLFLPWHRWFMFFHERILQTLLGDPSFSLVFWNWDNQQNGGNVVPEMFARNGSVLYDEKRNPAAMPPALVQLVPGAGKSSMAIIKENLHAVYASVVAANTAELFMGGRYVTGTDITNATVMSAPLGGLIENGVHNAVHFWTGNPNLPLSQDMGTFLTAARDPIFYAHHGNVDRLWDVWRTRLPGGPRADHSDPDFLKAEFLFYDENARLVKVNVSDALDNFKLNVSYPAVAADQLWINFSATAATHGSAVAAAVALGVDIVRAYPHNGVISLGSRFAAIVMLPSFSLYNKAGTQVLVVQGLRVSRDSFTSVRAFVNLPSADVSTDTSSAEYLGSFNIIPTAGKHRKLVTNAKFAIGDSLQRLGLQHEAEVVVTLVVSGSLPVTIEGLLVRYD